MIAWIIGIGFVVMLALVLIALFWVAPLVAEEEHERLSDAERWADRSEAAHRKHVKGVDGESLRAPRFGRRL